MIEPNRRRTVVALLLTTSALPFACAPSTAASPAGTFDGASVPSDDAEKIPCVPRLVLQTVCQQCHQSPPVRGAPFSLVTWSDVRRVTRDGPVRQLMLDQIEARRMPLAPVTIDERSRAALLEWLRAGAPAGTASTCKDAGGPDARPVSPGQPPEEISDASTMTADADAESDADVPDAADAACE